MNVTDLNQGLESEEYIKHFAAWLWPRGPTDEALAAGGAALRLDLAFTAKGDGGGGAFSAA